MRDVLIIGAGLSGLCTAAAPRFLGVNDVEVLDRAPAGLEGPWITSARMNTLRTPKEATGPPLGVPSLTPRAWYARALAPRPEKVERIPRSTWMEYLVWYRRVLGLPVRNGVTVRAAMPRIDKFSGVGSRGTVLGFQALPIATRAAVFAMDQQAQLPAPRASVLRVSRHANARFHFGCPIEQMAEQGDTVELTTPRGTARFDYVILATGFTVDAAQRPELAALAPHLLLWRDLQQQPGSNPVLGAAFELKQRSPAYPRLRLRGGGHARQADSGIPSISDGARRLTQGLVASLFAEDQDEFLARFAAYDTPELLGDEWTATATLATTELETL